MKSLYIPIVRYYCIYNHHTITTFKMPVLLKSILDKAERYFIKFWPLSEIIFNTLYERMGNMKHYVLCRNIVALHASVQNSWVLVTSWLCSFFIINALQNVKPISQSQSLLPHDFAYDLMFLCMPFFFILLLPFHSLCSK